MYRILTFILIFAASVTSSTAQFRKLEKKNHSVNKTLKEFLADPDFTSADFGFYAMDLKTGQVISSYRPDKSLMPASNQKLITTATMLELYGPEYRFSTQLEFTGNLDTIHRVLRGDIIIRGGGDPSLGSKYFGPERDTIFLGFWLDAVRSLGIDSIAGAIVADADIYSDEIVPVTWSWVNMGNYYGAGACGLSIYDNYFTIYFNTPSTAGDTAQIAEIWPDIEGLTFINRALADSINYDNLNIYGAPLFQRKIAERGTAPGKNRFRGKRLHAGSRPVGCPRII
jgi:serine-type D-Ala-D-Ala carboxypeptidase/endopeptidase (penicillin-binding protein 4)